jgi:DNA-binding NtrC family response regulator
MADEARLRVLVYFDGPGLAEVEAALKALPAELCYAAAINDAVSLLGASPFDAILLASTDPQDLSRLVAACDVPIIVVDPTSNVPAAVRAMRDGAQGYVCSAKELSDAMAHVIDHHRPEIARPRWTAEERTIFARIVNRSPAMNEVIERLRAIAGTRSTTALILGESGVGKELIATAIHQLSDRRAKPFIPVDCSAIPETLLESELFGHEKGSFSGATGDRVGRMEMAHGGTLFLDEVGELPLPMQAKLLRALEQRQIWRVGTTQPRAIDVRVVAATNRDLKKLVDDNLFRADLYYRLSVFLIHVPALRERGADVLHLADHFVQRFNRELGREVEGFTPAARAKLVAFSFPGNVRELKNIIEEAMVAAKGAWLDADDLNIYVIDQPTEAMALPADDVPREMIELAWGAGALAKLEAEAIRRALSTTGGNQTRAAQLLGIGRLALARAMTRHGLKPTNRPGRPASDRRSDADN